MKLRVLDLKLFVFKDTKVKNSEESWQRQKPKKVEELR